MPINIKSEGEVKSIFTNTPVLSASATYSDPIGIERSGYFGVWMSAGPASATSGAATYFWYEMSYDDTATNFVCAGRIATNTNKLSGVTSAVAINPYPMPWIRFGISATDGTVESDAVITAKLFEQ